MDGPFYRRDLVSGEAAKRYEGDERQKFIDTEVERFIFEIKRSIVGQTKNVVSMGTRSPQPGKSFVYKLPYQQRHMNTSLVQHTVVCFNQNIIVHISDILPKLLEKLKKVFPDTVIQIDPMKTYIHFDWSIPENLDVD
jgi:hypothetical protein